MQKRIPSQSSFLDRARVLLALVLCSTGMGFAALSFGASAGGWSIVTSANTANPINALRSVSCASSSDCWTAGYYKLGSHWQTLIEHWDGKLWAVVPSPNDPILSDSLLYGVTCVSTSECWAVGGSDPGVGVARVLIERWDGVSWTVVTPINANIEQNAVLSGVTCSAESDCWAVGYYLGANADQTLTAHWDGTSWTIVASPNTGPTQSNRLNGVTCSSASDCWAVGNHDVGTPIGGAAPQQTLAEHWDGTSWSIIATPTPRINYDILLSVSCTSASNCETVGFYAVNRLFRTLVERWDGNSWTIVDSPNPKADQDNVLKSVACNADSDCWAVGDYNSGVSSTPSQQTLIEYWDGNAWTIADSPNTSNTLPNFLFGVTCAASPDCWTVGNHETDTGAGTLIERYTSSPAQLIAVVSRKVHGSTGNFDIDLPLTGSRGIECRSGGENGDYTIVFTFANPLTSIGSATVTAETGSVSNRRIGADAHQYIVDLSGVTNAQTVTISLTSVSDSAGNSSAIVSASMAVLIGDTTADGFVNSGDIAQTKSQSGVALTTANFREDVNTDGALNSGDIALVKSKSGTALP